MVNQAIPHDRISRAVINTLRLDGIPFDYTTDVRIPRCHHQPNPVIVLLENVGIYPTARLIVHPCLTHSISFRHSSIAGATPISLASITADSLLGFARPNENSVLLKHEPPETVSRLLSDANRKFSDGEVLQASELMWKATRQAVAAVAARWDWPCASDDDVSQVVRRLDKESGSERTLLGKFGIAETFQYNATQDILEYCEIEAAREVVVDLINHLLSQLAKPRQPGMNTEEHLAVDRGELP